MKKAKSFKYELIRTFAFIIILLVFSLGLVAIFNLYNNKIDSISHNQNVILKQTNVKIETLLNEIEDLAKYLELNYYEDKNLLKYIMETKKNISSVLILSKDGILKDFYSKSNKNIYRGFDYSKKAYFKNLKESNNYLSDVFLSLVDEKPTISFSFKMKSDIGVFLISLTDLSNFINEFKNYDESHSIKIFDRNGTIIIDPDNQKLVSERFNALNSQMYDKLINKEKEFTPVIFGSFEDNLEDLGSFVKSKKTGWIIVVREDYSIIKNSIIMMIVFTIVVIVLFVLSAILASIKLTDRLFKSLEDLKTITSKIEKGDYSFKIEKSFYSEFNSLYDSFNKMQKQINSRELSLEESLKTFKLLIDSTMEVLIIHNNGICVDVNDICINFFNFEKKERFINKSILDFISFKDIDINHLNFDENIEPFEVEITRDDGYSFEVIIQNRVLNLQGRKISIFALIDISELKEKDRLLSQKSKMASMGEMLQNIAHQWKQPLCSITATTSTALIQNQLGVISSESLDNHLSNINTNIDYLSNTIEDFSNYFKPEKEMKSFLMKEVMENTFKILESKIKSSDIKLNLKFLEKSILLKGYQNEFIQVLINILNNSIDALLENKINNKYIEIEESIKEDKYQLKIKDNGGGIDKDVIEKIFDPYFTTKYKAQGTGIGLYMSMQIVSDHMNGDLSVKNIDLKIENQSYKGACFIIQLPVLDK